MSCNEIEEKKRRVEDDSSSSSDDSDDDFVGPSLNVDSPKEDKQQSKKRKTKTFIDESNLIANILLEDKYGYAYTQESSVSCISQGSLDDSIFVSGLKNGTIKFWRKSTPKDDEANANKNKDDTGAGQLEFIKQFIAHPRKEISQLIVDSDGQRLASIAKNDTNIKIFDLATLDMIQVLNLNFLPNTNSNYVSCWYKMNNVNHIIVNEADSNKIHIINPEDDEHKTVKAIHKSPLNAIAYNYKYKCLVSADTKGMVEYWNPDTEDLPKAVEFKYKSETGLLAFVKNRSSPSCISFSPDYEAFASISYPDNHVRLFHFRTGKLLKDYNESIETYEKEELNVEPKLINSERKLYLDELLDMLEQRNIIFDESGKFLIFGTLLGIKILSVQTNKVIRLLGKEDQLQYNVRFNQLIFSNKSLINKYNTEMLSSNNSILKSSLNKTPILLASSVNSNKIFLFNSSNDHHKDIDLTSKSRKTPHKAPIKRNMSKVTLHTTLGDIKINLFTQIVPKTTENFIKLCETSYYNNTIFHRVIKDFMVQTGDPLGNGTGGESYWGGYLKDEFSPLLTHSKPFIVSMANSGPNTNGSQFFITTEKAPWLDNKHTIFGEVTDGFEAIRSIESVETDSDDRPLDQVVLISTGLEE